MLSRPSFPRAISLATTVAIAAAAPCDIYGQAGNHCVAAHSTTRALYDNYNGKLYQVLRNSDGSTTDISTLSAGGVANAASQDSFCKGSTCVISIIYDQSGNNNNLSRAPSGGASAGPLGNGDDLAGATGAPVTVNGKPAYGVFISPGTGYRNDATSGIATGDEAEGLYAVFDGTHYNSACCFDYGNAEVSNDDTGAGHMEAIYFGSNTGYYGSGSGSGPWIQVDMENGLFAEGSTSANPNDVSLTNPFVTAVVKGEPNQWAIRGGDATSGGLTTFYSGARPTIGGYNPMSKEGAIILGIGGDNSDGAQGTFYEGVMTSGYPSDDTENAVQANIVAAKYAPGQITTGPAVKVGSTITIQVTTPGYTNRYIAHNGNQVITEVVTSSNPTAAAQWNVQQGLANSDCISFESADTPGSFIRHSGFELYVDPNDNGMLFADDATYCPQAGLDGQSDTNTFRSYSYPARNFRHYNAILYIASQGGPEDFDNANLYSDDTSFVVGTSFQS